jgi:hypothetical protein
MSSNQLAAYLPDVIEVIQQLNKSLSMLDMAGLSVAAIHVDAAISNLHSEIALLPKKIPDLDVFTGVDFSTLDAMSVSLFGAA